MDQGLLDRLLESGRLPSPPAVALHVLDLVQDPKVSVSALAGTIGSDPSLTSKLLRTANSSFYSQARRIATVNDALVVLGLNSVRTLALGFSLVDNFRSHQQAGFDHDAFWRRSLLTAVAARTIAQRSRSINKEEAFLAGLLLNIGVLALGSELDDYGALFQDAGGSYVALAELEEYRLGANHREVGAAVAEAWNLPADLIACIAHHADPDQAPPAAIDIVRMAAAGEALAELYAAADPGAALLRYRDSVVSFGLDNDAADALIGEVEQSTKIMESVFDLHGRSNVSASALLARANDALLQLSLQATQDASRLATENRELASAAATDALTGVANRRRFEEFVGDQYRMTARYSVPFSLIYIDLDYFKDVNDTHGHATGDRLLVGVASALHEAARGADLVARLGGDEFAIALPTTTLAEAIAAAHRFHAAIRGVRVQSEAGAEVTSDASLGVAEVDIRVHPDAGAVLSSADAALYQSKRGGRGRVEALQTTRAA